MRATMESGDDARFFDSAFAAILAVSAAAGVDHHYGRRLGTVFRRAGLAEVSVAGLVSEWGRAHPLAELFRLTFQRIRDRVVEAGSLTGEQFERLSKLMESPRTGAGSCTVTAIQPPAGRRFILATSIPRESELPTVIIDRTALLTGRD